MTGAWRTRVADGGDGGDGADRAAVWALYEAALRGHIEAIWGWEASWQQADFARAFARAATLMIERDGVVCGYCQLDLQAPTVYLRMLVLAPEARSQGIGAALLRAILQRTRAAGRSLRLRVFKVNQAAQRFYAREGWLAESSDDVAVYLRPPGEETTGVAAVDLVAGDFVMCCENHDGRRRHA